MITKNASSKGQMQIVSLDQLVPEDHILHKIDSTVDFSFIYDLVEEKYSSDNGRPSIDPVMLIKIPIIQYLFGIKSMRQTIKDIEVMDVLYNSKSKYTAKKSAPLMRIISR